MAKAIIFNLLWGTFYRLTIIGKKINFPPFAKDAE
jgi:hypothetical protein